MARRFFDFLCENSHKTEAFVDSEEYTVLCKECGSEAKRIVSAPMMKLEGITGSFPSAYDAWERKRAEKLVQERKQNS
jgi:hypothetical protein